MRTLCPPSDRSPKSLTLHEVVHDVHGHWEDDGRVVLGRDAVQRLKVTKLQTEMKRGGLRICLKYVVYVCYCLHLGHKII